jgi:hypothetical protein
MMVPGTGCNEAKIFGLERTCRRETLDRPGIEGNNMVREVQLLAVGLILAFLGAIVVGVF